MSEEIIQEEAQKQAIIKSNVDEKSERKASANDIRFVIQRLDSQSRRISKLQNKLAQIISNQQHYLKVRLPNVLKREEARSSFSEELNQAKKLLRSLNKQRFTFLSNSKDADKRKERHIGMFTYLELQRLRRLLNVDHSFEYMLYRKDNYKELKNKHVLFLDESEKRKLKYILTKAKKEVIIKSLKEDSD